MADPTRKELLDAGQPAMPDPPEFTPELERWGDTFRGLLMDGTAKIGSVMAGLSIPTVETGITVTSDVATLTDKPGIITVVHANGTPGGTIFPTIRLSGTPVSGQVTITYDSNGVPTLTFATADSVDSCDVLQLRVPDELTDFLNETAPLPP